MRTGIGIAVGTIVAFGSTGNAFADADTQQGYFTVMGSYIDDDSKRGTEDAVNGGQLGIGYALNEAWNFEGIVSAASPEGRISQEHLGLGLDVQRVFRRSERFSPYLHAGVGYFTVDSVGPGASEDGTMLSVGAGFLLDLFESNVALRGEWRNRLDGASDGSLRDNLFSIGLQIPFGETSPRFDDSDGDGISDSVDRCRATPAGVSVDVYGCELDDDNDGVKNSRDKCPRTPIGVLVNSEGCAADSDGDAVTDDMDRCPRTPKSAAVDAKGCELDGDNDGVVDRLDECRDSAAGVQVDIKGCEIKEDIALPGVNFESNSDRLLAGAESVLNAAAATLRKNPSIRVEVAGHTDSDGAADYNDSLSARRAKTVHDHLANRGVASDRMTVRGYGESQAIADNGSAPGKAKNRRVVLRIVER